MKKYITIIVVVLVSFLILLGTEAMLAIPKDADLINNDWQVLSPEKSVSQLIPNTFVFDINNTPKFSEGVYTLTSKFYVANDLERASFVLTQQPDHGFRIWIDNKFIAEVGDLIKGQSNIWIGSDFFPIPNGISKGIHSIKFEIYAVEQLSLLTSPYIIDVNDHPLKYLTINIINEYLAIFLSGITFLFGVLFISLGLIDWKNEKIKAMLGLGFILMTLYFIDYLTVEILLVSYLTFKKIIFTFLSLGFVLTFSVIMSKLDGGFIKKRIKQVIVFLILGFLILYIPQELIIFKMSQLFIVFLGLSIFFIILSHPKLLFWERDNINFIIIGIISLSSFTIRFLFFSFLKTPYTNLTHIGVFIYIISIFIYFITDYINQSKKVLVESKRADHYFNKSVIDPLTNVNNRNILSYISLTEMSFVLFICDLDDFKAINDIYGHKAGDEVLIKFSYLIKRYIRDSDYIIRLGGDEFCIILLECSSRRGLEIGESIWGAIPSEFVKINNDTIHFSSSGGGVVSLPGENFESALIRADKNLYEIKNITKGYFKYS